MSNNEVLRELKAIERRQIKSDKQSAIPFGIAIAVIGWNFFGPASQTKDIGLMIASGLLMIIGFGIMMSGIIGRAKLSRESE